MRHAFLAIAVWAALFPGAVFGQRADVDLYGSDARAVAFIAQTPTDGPVVFLWSGQPVAYLAEGGSIYGFNGRHLGWWRRGTVYDHEGNVVAAVAGRFISPVPVPPFKGFRQFLPFKAFRDFAPFEPFFNPTSWSKTSATAFFSDGIK
jgi:hypothetical protein